jgi:zinc transporter, ZIP family
MNDVVRVFLAALVTALATGLGALPFAFVPRMSERAHGIAASAAGGMMIAASVFVLADEALHRGSVIQVSIGMLAGAAFFAWTSRRVSESSWRLGTLSASESRQGLLVLLAMFVHSIPEGVAIGVGYATGEVRFGLLLTVAIAVHNVPEGIAVSLPLRATGMSVLRCAGYAILTSVPQPVAAVPAFMLVSWLQPLLPGGLGFAGGAMIFLVIAELVPASLERCSRADTAWGCTLGLIGMLGVTAAIGL